jgi:hypothetical protein
MGVVLGLPREGGVNNRRVEQIDIVQCGLLGVGRVSAQGERQQGEEIISQ